MTRRAAAQPPVADVCVILTRRLPGGHEGALFAWLADAVSACGLRPAIVAPGSALAAACDTAGLARWCWRGVSPLQALLAWRRDRPVLLAPGGLHAQAWLTAAAVVLRRLVWLYVPMTCGAADVGWRGGAQRDRLLAPWLRRVDGWITLDERQAGRLRQAWAIRAPVHRLPNLARVRGAAPSKPAPAADGRLRVAVVGRFDPWQKGLDWLAATIRSDPAWQAGFYWHFQGRGVGAPALRALAADLGPAQARVHDHAPLDVALAASDVLLLPSRFEGLPLVALEAIARGWPVVASRACHLDGLLPASALFDFGDAVGLRRALEHVRHEPARAAAVRHSQARLQARERSAGYAQALRGVVEALQQPHARALP